MYVTPAGDRAEPTGADPSSVVVGKHLSKHGLDFYHRDPLPDRHMIVSVEDADNNWIRLLLDITWCRFIRSGWYSSGGKFLGVVEDPSVPRPDVETKTADGVDEDLVLCHSQELP
jgi:hypothetical protein